MKQVKIKNYTSTVPPERTAARIEQALADAGASNISKNYTEGELSGIDFVINTAFGLVSFRIPIKVAEAEKILLERASANWRSEVRKRVKEQAKKTAWRIAQDWIEVQLALVTMKQAELLQVLLPYAVKDNQTFFDIVKGNGMGLLAAPKTVEAVEGEFVEDG